MPDDDLQHGAGDAGREDRPDEGAPEDSTQPDAPTEGQDGAHAERVHAEDSYDLAPEAGEDEFGIDQKRMPFSGHLVELRTRLLICIFTVAGAFLIFFIGFRFHLYDLLSYPVRAAGERVAAKVAAQRGTEVEVNFFADNPPAMFITSAYICLLAAVALTVPVTLYEMWAFVAPGLKRKERRLVKPILLVGSGLFALGVLFAYTQVVPVAMRFLMQDTAKFDGVELRFNIARTLKFESLLLVVFGFAFEMPLVIVALTRVGILTPEGLARKRRHAIIILFVIGALLTPPDVVTQLLLAGPMIVLLEISIQASKLFRPKESRWDRWERQWAAQEAADGARRAAAPAAPQEADEQPYDEDEEYEDPYADQYAYEYGEEPPPEEEPPEETEPGEGQEPDEQQHREKEDSGEEGPEEDTTDDDSSTDDPSADDLPPDSLMH
ncbi:MAG: twin-arginine translocase subunit TatC [Candidatus Brocadiia bacterium]